MSGKKKKSAGNGRIEDEKTGGRKGGYRHLLFSFLLLLPCPSLSTVERTQATKQEKKYTNLSGPFPTPRRKKEELSHTCSHTHKHTQVSERASEIVITPYPR